MGHGEQEEKEKQDLDFGLWNRFGQTSLHVPESSCGASSLVPGHKPVASDHLPVPAADSGHTNISSSIPPLRCCILLHHVHFTHSFSEPCCRYKVSLPGSHSAWPSVCLAPAALPVRPAKAISARGGHAAMTGSGSSMGRRFSSGGGHLRNSPCIMTGSCLKYPGGLRLPLSIPLTLTLTSFLTTSELTQSSPISCSSFHHWAPTPACCSAGLPCWVTT